MTTKAKSMAADLTCGGVCRLLFAGEKALAAHRRRGRCLDPATVGLVRLRSRDVECWGFHNPGAADEWFGELAQPPLPLRIPAARKHKP